MKRTTPLKRTSFKRREGQTATREAKPRAEQAVAPKKCRMCSREFIPKNSLHSVCGQLCASKYARQLEKQRQEREKAERQADREKRESLKTIGQLEDECRRIVQKIARIRDRHDGCISCHMPANYGGAWHGSHFRPAGNNSAVQFHLWNIHKACAQCNLFKGGNIGAYRPRLIEKIGRERVEWLESQTQPKKWERDYLMRFKRVMGKRLRRVEKAAKACA